MIPSTVAECQGRPLPLGPIIFVFMNFWRTIDQNIRLGPTFGVDTPIWPILDPPLVNKVQSSCTHPGEQVINLTDIISHVSLKFIYQTVAQMVLKTLGMIW